MSISRKKDITYIKQKIKEIDKRENEIENKIEQIPSKKSGVLFFRAKITPFDDRKFDERKRAKSKQNR